MTGRELTIRLWESSCGREGLWCRACRRTTPVERLLLEESGRAVLCCETCNEQLRSGPSWLTAPIDDQHASPARPLIRAAVPA